jgi:hypothetical protein
MGYDTTFQRFVISGNTGQTYYSAGSNVIATLGSTGSGGLLQSYGEYLQARATQPVDYGQRATLYMDSVTQNLVLRWGGIGYDLKIAMQWGGGKYDQVVAIFLMLFLTIVLIDQLSSRYRQKLVKGS